MDGLIIAGRDGQPIMLSRFRNGNTLYPMMHVSYLCEKIKDVLGRSENGAHSSLDPAAPMAVRDIPPVLSVPLADSVLESSSESDGMEDEVADDDDDDHGSEEHETSPQQGSQTLPDLPDEALAWSDGAERNYAPKAPESNSETCIPLEGGSVLCHIMVGSLRFLCPMSHDLDPLISFAFLHKAADVLQDYLVGSKDPALLTEDLIRQHFDIVYQLMEEMLDGEGNVLLTEINALKDIVVPPRWLDKIANKVGLNSSPEHARMSLASPVPWRRTNSRYSKNEVYLDMIESIEGVIDANGCPVALDVWGKLTCSAWLSGMPELLVSLNHPSLLELPAWHRCIRQQTWEKQQKLCFVPPDGECVLSEFRIRVPSKSTSSSCTLKRPISSDSSASEFNSNSLPMKVYAYYSPYNAAHGGLPFNITVDHALDPAYDLQDVCIDWLLGDGVQGVDATTQVNTVATKTSMSSDIGSIPNLSRTAGNMVFDRKQQHLRWVIPKISPCTQSVLKGTILSTSACRPMYALDVQFSVFGYTMSGLRVSSIQIQHESYAPTKGARVCHSGRLEWRLAS